jgi:hypothetical protein
MMENKGRRHGLLPVKTGVAGQQRTSGHSLSEGVWHEAIEMGWFRLVGETLAHGRARLDISVVASGHTRSYSWGWS